MPKRYKGRAAVSLDHSTEVANQWKAKSHIPYSDAANSHIKLIWTRDDYPYPFLSQENVVLTSSELNTLFLIRKML